MVLQLLNDRLFLAGGHHNTNVFIYLFVFAGLEIELKA